MLSLLFFFALRLTTWGLHEWDDIKNMCCVAQPAITFGRGDLLFHIFASIVIQQVGGRAVKKREMKTNNKIDLLTLFAEWVSEWRRRRSDRGATAEGIWMLRVFSLRSDKKCCHWLYVSQIDLKEKKWRKQEWSILINLPRIRTLWNLTLSTLSFSIFLNLRQNSK